MSEEQNVETQNTETTSPETPDVPQGTSEAPAPDAAISVEGVEPPAYTPNFKYKVFGEEKEVPEKYRAFVKDADSEKELRDFFEKAEAMPTFKQRYEDTKNRYVTLENTLKSEIQPKLEYFHSLAGNLRESYEKGDFQGICEALGIPADNLLGLAAKEATLRQNPSEYKLAQAERERMVATRTAEGQLSAKESQTMEIEGRYINRMLELTMSRDDVKRYADAFESRMGKPGAFEEEVRQQGHALYLMGKKTDPVEIIESMMKKYPMQAASQAQATSPAQPSAGNQNAGKPPVIPTVQGGNVSSMSKKKSFKSIDEMKKAWENQRNGG